MTCLAKSVQLPTQPESQLVQRMPADSNESIKQLKERIDHLDSEVNNLQSEITTSITLIIYITL